MRKSIVYGLLLMLTMLLCSCNTNTDSADVSAAEPPAGTFEEEPPVDVLEEEPPTDVSVNDSDNSDVISDYGREQMELFELVQGKWICETEAAYIDIYLAEDAEYDWDYEIRMGYNPDVHVYGYELNDFVTFEAGVPHSANPPEDGILENETAVCFNSRYGEFSILGLLVVDNERQYIKYQPDNIEGWYTFYPYESEMDINEYIYSQPQ
ncbi:MAG: hypothetical protein IJZ00_10590 [Lachnospiraceae bacterium]|nr:hypothetical protein [Lachnospiraceae bacterium]